MSHGSFDLWTLHPSVFHYSLCAKETRTFFCSVSHSLDFYFIYYFSLSLSLGLVLHIYGGHRMDLWNFPVLPFTWALGSNWSCQAGWQVLHPLWLSQLTRLVFLSLWFWFLINWAVVWTSLTVSPWCHVACFHFPLPCIGRVSWKLNVEIDQSQDQVFCFVGNGGLMAWIKGSLELLILLPQLSKY